MISSLLHASKACLMLRRNKGKDAPFCQWFDLRSEQRDFFPVSTS